jgi:hypothetical protein
MDMNTTTYHKNKNIKQILIILFIAVTITILTTPIIIIPSNYTTITTASNINNNNNNKKKKIIIIQVDHRIHFNHLLNNNNENHEFSSQYPLVSMLAISLWASRSGYRHLIYDINHNTHNKCLYHSPYYCKITAILAALYDASSNNIHPSSEWILYLDSDIGLFTNPMGRLTNSWSEFRMRTRKIEQIINDPNYSNVDIFLSPDLEWWASILEGQQLYGGKSYAVNSGAMLLRVNSDFVYTFLHEWVTCFTTTTTTTTTNNMNPPYPVVVNHNKTPYEKYCNCSTLTGENGVWPFDQDRFQYVVSKYLNDQQQSYNNINHNNNNVTTNKLKIIHKPFLIVTCTPHNNVESMLFHWCMVDKQHYALSTSQELWKRFGKDVHFEIWESSKAFQIIHKRLVRISFDENFDSSNINQIEFIRNGQFKLVYLNN